MWCPGSEGVPPCPARSVGDHRGDGTCEKSDGSSWIWQLGKSSSSPTPIKERGRLPKHVSFLGWSKGIRWAVSPVIFLAKGQPHGAYASVVTQAHFLPPGMDANREAALQWFHVRLFFLQFLQFEMVRRRSECPKWFVPGGAWIVPELRQLI